MDTEKDFHMNGGVGRTSYAQNSSLQKKVSEMVKHITLEAVKDLLLSDQVPIFTSIGIADLGCSSGPNTLATVKQILEAVEATLVLHGKKIEELRVYLNDLPTNDFNSIFKSLPDFLRNLKKERGIDGEGNKYCSSIFIGAYPGSFYARLFPASSLHFIHSSHSLHWLSKVPSGIYDDQGRSKNKGKVYISESSPPCVFQAYLKQFQEDFFLFLRLRSEELVNGGKMVLIFLGRESQDPVHDRGNSFLWELLSRSLANLVSKGEIEEEKLDSYETNFYAPSKIEIEEQVKAEGSFRIERLEVFERDMTVVVGGGRSYGKVVAMAIRAIQESVLRSHFGQGIDLDSLFDHYGKLVDDEMSKQEISTIISVLVLAKSCVNE